MRYHVAEPGTCCCSCAGCKPWQPFDDAADYRRWRKCPPPPARHCRHILFCGLGGSTAEIELTVNDIEIVET